MYLRNKVASLNDESPNACIICMLGSSSRCDPRININSPRNTEAGGYNASVIGSDMIFLDPNKDRDKDVVMNIFLSISITDPTYTPANFSFVVALFLDPGMLL